MNQPPSPNQTRHAGSTPLVESILPFDKLTPQSLPLTELEALLRLAREKLPNQATSTQNEPLGPGDVQHLRGESLPPVSPMTDDRLPSDWPKELLKLDQLRQQSDRQIAEAILAPNLRPVIPPSNKGADLSHETSSRPKIPGELTLEDLADIDLDVTIELGRTEILIDDVLKLRHGSVVSLDKLAGDPVDVVANGRLVARGELLVVDGKFGVRLSEIL